MYLILFMNTNTWINGTEESNERGKASVSPTQICNQIPAPTFYSVWHNVLALFPTFVFICDRWTVSVVHWRWNVPSLWCWTLEGRLNLAELSYEIVIKPSLGQLFNLLYWKKGFCLFSSKVLLELSKDSCVPKTRPASLITSIAVKQQHRQLGVKSDSVLFQQKPFFHLFRVWHW